jgi:hypothetical protein
MGVLLLSACATETCLSTYSLAMGLHELFYFNNVTFVFHVLRYVSLVPDVEGWEAQTD